VLAGRAARRGEPQNKPVIERLSALRIHKTAALCDPWWRQSPRQG
jgi:hypothetical protein